MQEIREHWKTYVWPSEFIDRRKFASMGIIAFERERTGRMSYLNPFWIVKKLYRGPVETGQTQMQKPATARMGNRHEIIVVGVISLVPDERCDGCSATFQASGRRVASLPPITPMRKPCQLPLIGCFKIFGRKGYLPNPLDYFWVTRYGSIKVMLNVFQRSDLL